MYSKLLLFGFILTLIFTVGCSHSSNASQSDNSEIVTSSTEKISQADRVSQDDSDFTVLKTVSILYVGNSFVYTGEVPRQVEKLAIMYGIETLHYSIAPGGATLADTKTQAIDAMRGRKFDYAVFQDYGGRQLDGRNFANDVKELCDVAKETGATPVLYNPAFSNVDGKPDKESQALLTDGYEKEALLNGAILVNAADAWIYAYDKLPDISLYNTGDYHANSEGAYLTACVFASTLLNLHIKDISEWNLYSGKDAIPLGEAAWEFVTYYKANGELPTVTVPTAPAKTKK